MDITPLIPKGRQIISHYGDGGFVINGTAHKENVIICPEHTTSWRVTGIEDATSESFHSLFESELPELLLIGTGKKFTALSTELRSFFRDKNIAVDAMDTGAACRTYTVLLAEGRSIAAALIAV